MTMYEAALATGSCEHPLEARVLARFDGADGVQAHVDIPVMPLTGGSYVLIVRREGSDPSYGCGVIKHSWF
jgi:hypothetical protein